MLELVARVSHHPQERVVRIDEVARCVAEHDPDDAGLGEPGEPELARTARLLAAAMRLARFPLAQLSFDDRRQAREAILEQVVIGARAHRLDGGLLPDRTGHDDERQVASVLLGHGQRGEGAEPRHRPVGDHDVPALGLQRGAHGLRILDALELDRAAGAANRLDDELGIHRRILDEQDAQRLAHGSSRTTDGVTRPRGTVK